MSIFPSRPALKAAFFKYLPIGLTVFFIGLLWNFPYEKAIGRLTERIARQSGIQIEAERLSPALPIGIKATKAHITGQSDLDMTFDTLRLTLSPFSPFTYPFSKSFSVFYTVTRDQAKWKGGASYGKEDLSFDVSTSGWKVDRAIPLDVLNPILTGSSLKVVSTLQIAAGFSGKTQAIQRTDLSTANGNISMTASAATIEAPYFKTLRFDQIALEGKMDKGKLNIKSVTFKGPDLTGTLSGWLTFAPYIQGSTIDLDGKLTLSDKFRESMQAQLPLLENLLGIRVTGDGNVVFKVKGPVHQPTITGY